MLDRMRLAYVICAHRLPDNLARLVRRLANPDEVVAIHVDKRTPDSVFRQMAGGVRGLPNVHFLPRNAIHYSSYGQVRAALKGLELLRRRGVAYDHVSFLTGQDYPIKPLERIREQLRPYVGRSFVEHFELPRESWWHGGMPRLEQWCRFGDGGIRSTPRRKLRPLVQQAIPYGLRPHGGGAYWTLSRAHADYTLDFLRRHRRYARFFKHAELPEELFFQTILLNSPHRDEIVCDDARFTSWTPGAQSPNVLGMRDLPAITESRHLFARKFDVTVDVDVMDALDRLADP
jgi:hypothetical protein